MLDLEGVWETTYFCLASFSTVYMYSHSRKVSLSFLARSNTVYAHTAMSLTMCAGWTAACGGRSVMSFLGPLVGGGEGVEVAGDGTEGAC